MLREHAAGPVVTESEHRSMCDRHQEIVSLDDKWMKVRVKETPMRNGMTRRDFTGCLASTPLALAMSGMTSFEAEGRLHVIVHVTEYLGMHQLQNISTELKQFFPASAKVLIVLPWVEVNVPVSERQWFHSDYACGLPPSECRDANGAVVSCVKWCHLPTGVVGQFDDNYVLQIRQHPAPLKLVPLTAHRIHLKTESRLFTPSSERK